MPSPSFLFAHIVFATHQRRPLLPPRQDEALAALFVAKASELDCSIAAVGIASDHVHLVLKFSPARAIAEVVRHLKGASAFASSRQRGLSPIRWQQKYWAESVSASELEPLIRYVRSQRSHHDPTHPAEHALDALFSHP